MEKIDNKFYLEEDFYQVRCNSTPFILYFDCGKPLMAVGKKDGGGSFSSPIFLLKNPPKNSCVELIILEPVAMDGCTVEFPNTFYSLKKTNNCFFISKNMLTKFQSVSSEFVDRPILKVDTDKC
ncbi:CotY/CotZ family spore coat protein [Lysinibacillus sp. BW-2-10]|uniref:CotY/CotZ family spore coat protein n=1 Tax=Lysinibacillus sp. BW-2-10 TaxID=2590030 RepID=UPI00117E078E|nr:CotY/CotZ family spore coat protein [Lysinibacillus sp. BW-2-10]TSI03562.1 hypothetical protein FJQ64_15775 [Lysinibacillus sp. BW-2-10]